MKPARVAPCLLSRLGVPIDPAGTAYPWKALLSRVALARTASVPALPIVVPPLGCGPR